MKKIAVFVLLLALFATTSNVYACPGHGGKDKTSGGSEVIAE